MALKMSDVFKLPLRNSSGAGNGPVYHDGIKDAGGVLILGYRILSDDEYSESDPIVPEPECSSAIVQAVNAHDSLLAAVERMRGLLRECLPIIQLDAESLCDRALEDRLAKDGRIHKLVSAHQQITDLLTGIRAELKK